MMNQTLVANVNNKNVYLINNNNIPFYVCLPSEKKANIVLNLVDDVNGINMTNNMESLTKEITNMYNKFDYADIAVVSPIIDNNLLEQAKLNNNEQIFGYLDKVMSYLINTVYKLLRDNNIEVDNKIKLNNNRSYSDFNDWFVKRYNGRVELADYNSMSNVNAISSEFEKESQTMDFASSAIANEVLDETRPIDTINNNVSTSPKEPGFVSYVLLGVIVAVISLVILYKLL
jgi:hypothetical protein